MSHSKRGKGTRAEVQLNQPIFFLLSKTLSKRTQLRLKGWGKGGGKIQEQQTKGKTTLYEATENGNFPKIQIS